MNKKNYWLLVILLLLSASAYAYKVTYQEFRRDQKQVVNFLAQLKTAEIDGVGLKRDGEETLLLRQADTWRVQGEGNFEVQEELMARALESLAKLAASELSLVSLKAENQALFGLGETAVELRLMSGDEELAQFKIGNSDGLRSYLGRSGDERSYLSLVDLSVWQTTDWRDKTIFDSDLELWQSLSVENKATRQKWSIKKVAAEWQSEAGEKLSALKVRPLINVLSQLSANQIAAQTMSGTGLEAPELIIKVSSDDLSNVLLIGQAQGGNYYAKRADSDQIYLIDKGLLELFAGGVEALRD